MQESNLTKIKFPISGMTCSACSSRLEKTLLKNEQFKNVTINLPLEEGRLELDLQQSSIKELKQHVKQSGFDIPEDKFHFKISGMTCATCAGRIEKRLQKEPYILEVTINLATEEAFVRSIKGALSENDIFALVDGTGFHAHALDQGIVSNEIDWDKICLISGIFLTLPLVMPMLVMPFGMTVHLNGWLQLALALPVQVIAGFKFYPSAWSALKDKSGNMDTLVSLGTSAAFGLSLYLLLSQGLGGHDLYFEASAAVTSLILLGKWLEKRAKSGVTQAIKALIKLRPKTALRIDQDGQETELPISLIAIGDLVKVKPGENIAVDGEIIQGRALIDESIITGESLPLTKQEGDHVISGSLNTDGVLIVKAEKTNDNTVLAQIIDLVQNAQSGKPPIQKLVDKIAAYFVPVVCLIALATFIGWLTIGNAAVETALIYAITVLVIACPCALGLATPTAIIAGTGVAAKEGILIKDAESLEIAYKVDTVVFDKTGTLTQGKLQIDQKVALSTNDQINIDQIAASLQTGSSHPIASAFQNLTDDIKPIHNFQNHAGRGVSGDIDGESYWLGNEKLIPSGVILPTVNANNTLVWLANEQEVLGYFTLKDTLRTTSRSSINELIKNKITPYLMSGDNAKTCEEIAKQTGIENIFTSQLPKDKAENILALQNAGYTVAMVGDGVNDAPALAQADLSIAMSGGTDVAIQTAHITLMQDNPELVGEALRISKATYRKIQQNLFWAFIYNVIALPAAAFGFLNPVIAGAAMALSSVSVVSNSLLLSAHAKKENK